jgi:HKD family nuclease
MTSDIRVRFLQAGQEFVNEIRKSILEYKKIRIAVAFVKEDAYSEIAESLRKALSNGCEIEFIVGASTELGITDSGVLGRLLELKEKYKDKRFLVNFYNNAGFHPKLFIFRKKDAVKIIIGSSNLTGGGVRNNVEANVIIETTPKHNMFKTVMNEFENWFKSADELNKNFAVHYANLSKQYTRLWGKLARRPQNKYSTPLPKSKAKYRINEKAVFWKVAPGLAGQQWRLWRQEIVDSLGIVAIGWDYLNEMMHLSEKEAIKQVKDRDPKVKPRYVYQQGKLFYYEMKEGDIIVAYSRRRIFGIGKIIGEKPYYEKMRNSNKQPYPIRRRVKWLWIDKARKPPKNIADVLSTYDTIHRIEDNGTINYIKDLIKSG